MANWIYTQIRAIPFYHQNEQQPYGETWAFIVSFSVLAAFTQVVLLATSVSLVPSTIVISFTVYFAFFLICTTLMQIPVKRSPADPPKLVQQFATSIQMSYSLYPAIHLIVYLVGYIALGGQTNIFRLVQIPIAAEQGLIFLGWLFVYSRPLQPEWLLNNSDNLEFLKYYLEMWWRVIRAGVTVILTMGVGLAVGMALRVEYYSTGQLAANALAIIPVGYPLGHYAFKKTKRVNTLIVQAVE